MKRMGAGWHNKQILFLLFLSWAFFRICIQVQDGDEECEWKPAVISTKASMPWVWELRKDLDYLLGIVYSYFLVVLFLKCRWTTQLRSVHSAIPTGYVRSNVNTPQRHKRLVLFSLSMRYLKRSLPVED